MRDVPTVRHSRSWQRSRWRQSLGRDDELGVRRSGNRAERRFRRAKRRGPTDNGFIQFALDADREAHAKPFWDLVIPLWKNVDIDMKEALDRRDSNDKDQHENSLRRSKAPSRSCPTQRLDARYGERRGSIRRQPDEQSKWQLLAEWEGEMLKDHFGRSGTRGHGPGSEPSGLPQTDWAI